MSIREKIQQKRFRSLAAHTFVSVVYAAEHLRQPVAALCARYGITGDQYNVLRILRGTHPGAYSREEIRNRLLRPTADATRLLDRLIRRGLVVREQGEEDRRLSLARITPEGLDLLERLDPEVEVAMAEATAKLTAEELRELVRLCDRLVG
jgi:DNA-binding MarR family transcriptional regulator